MDKDLRDNRISVAVHAAAAIIIAWASFSLNNNGLAGLMGIAVLIGIGYPLEKLAGKRGFKWWFANGIFIYLLIWLVGWTYLFNI